MSGQPSIADRSFVSYFGFRIRFRKDGEGRYIAFIQVQPFGELRISYLDAQRIITQIEEASRNEE